MGDAVTLVTMRRFCVASMAFLQALLLCGRRGPYGIGLAATCVATQLARTDHDGL